MKKIEIYFQQVYSADVADYILIMNPDMSMSDFIRNSYIRGALDADFGSDWVVVWVGPIGAPSFIAKQSTRNVVPAEVESYLDREWKKKYLNIKNSNQRECLLKVD